MSLLNTTDVVAQFNRIRLGISQDDPQFNMTPWITDLENLVVEFMIKIFHKYASESEANNKQKTTKKSKKNKYELDELLQETIYILSDVFHAEDRYQIQPLLANLIFMRNQNYLKSVDEETLQIVTKFHSDTEVPGYTQQSTEIRMERLTNFVDNLRKMLEFLLQTSYCTKFNGKSAVEILAEIRSLRHHHHSYFTSKYKPVFDCTEEDLLQKYLQKNKELIEKLMGKKKNKKGEASSTAKLHEDSKSKTLLAKDVNSKIKPQTPTAAEISTNKPLTPAQMTRIPGTDINLGKLLVSDSQQIMQDQLDAAQAKLIDAENLKLTSAKMTIMKRFFGVDPEMILAERRRIANLYRPTRFVKPKPHSHNIPTPPPPPKPRKKKRKKKKRPPKVNCDPEFHILHTNRNSLNSPADHEEELDELAMEALIDEEKEAEDLLEEDIEHHGKKKRKVKVQGERERASIANSEDLLDAAAEEDLEHHGKKKHKVRERASIALSTASNKKSKKKGKKVSLNNPDNEN